LHRPPPTPSLLVPSRPVGARAQLDKEQEKGAKKEEKLVAQMEAAKAKAAKTKAPAAAVKPAAKAPKGKGTKKEPVVVEDEGHYVKWTKKVLGAKGEKADDEMLAVLDAKGPAGLVKLLTKRYKSDQK
jgi:hypothetical protein